MRFAEVLVTGAGGLLGRYLLDALHGRCAVTGIDLKSPVQDVPFIEADITDPDAVRRAAAGQDAIVHVAALASIWAGRSASWR